MKICILTFFEDLLLRDTGPTVRIYNLAKGLASLGHEVHIVIPHLHKACTYVDNMTIHYIDGFFLRPILRILSKLLGVSRQASFFLYDIYFLARISRILLKSDIIQIEEQEAGGLLILAISKVFRKKVVVDCHDVFQALRVKHTTPIRRFLETFAERIAYKYANVLLTVSKKERDLLVSYRIEENKIHIIPNGVDVEAFNKKFDVSRIKEQYGLKGFHVVIFVGNIDFFPNKEAVNTINSIIAPKIRNEITNVKFLIVGRASNRIKTKTNDIIFTGKVNDVRELLSIADVAIAPLFHGSGTRLKILEYFACSLPVVSTPTGVEGLDVLNGVHAIIEHDIERFADKIVELLKNKGLGLMLGKAALELVINKYDWRKIITCLNAVYQNLLYRNESYKSRRKPN